MTFEEFSLLMKTFEKKIPLGIITKHLKDLKVKLKDIQKYILFLNESYTRTRVFKNDIVEIIVLAWKSGQRSLIHDHEGSVCALRIIDGEATETAFQKATNGHVYPFRSYKAETGKVISSFGNNIHQVSNLQDKKNLVSLHVYSPPLAMTSSYSLTTEKTEHHSESALHGGEGI